jgi:PAS domain S-box-containing protein
LSALTLKQETKPLNLHQIFLDEASVAVYQIGLDGRFLEANKMASRQTGYTRKELLSLSIFDIDKGVTLEKFEEIGRMIRENGSLKFISEFSKKDGTVFLAEITTSIIKHKGSEFAVSFVDDVSERVKIQNELRITQFCFDNASIAIYRIRSSDGKIVTINKKAAEQIGYTKEELCSMSIPDIDPTFSMDQRDEYQHRLNTDGPYTIESIHQHKNGTIFPVEILIDHIEFEKDEYHLTFVKDITKRKKAEEDQKKIEEYLMHTQKMQALGTLAGGIAHDFNNILSGILGYADLANRTSKDSNTSKYMHQIITAGERAKDLVGQILAFSSQNTVQKFPVDISIIVDEVLKLLKVTLPSTIKIQHNISSNLGKVLADGTQIHQLVLNLCTNACHAMIDKGGVLKLELRTRKIFDSDLTVDGWMNPGNYLELIVADTGHGMDKLTLSHIFDPYFTTKDEGEGTGLGLSVVHGIIRKIGGGIKVYSEPNVGTEFRILLPTVDREK